MADLVELRAVLDDLDRVVVALSGGVDSALLAWVANDTLGDQALAVTAVSPSFPAHERHECAELTAEWGMRWFEVETSEMENAAYRRNDDNRCFHCKDALMDELVPIAGRERAVVALGVNIDDLGDHRPGQTAAAQRGAMFPLVEAGFTKADVRAASRRLGLRTWDKPAAACLASRLPYGTEVRVELLAGVELAERQLRAIGFDDLRVRHYGDHARLEVPIDRFGDVITARADVVAAVKSAGYGYVTLDLEGLRSGNLNDAIRPKTR